MSHDHLHEVEACLGTALEALKPASTVDGGLSERLAALRARVQTLRASHGDASDIAISAPSTTSVRKAIASAIALLRARPSPMPVDETVLLSKLVVIQTELHTPKFSQIS